MLFRKGYTVTADIKEPDNNDKAFSGKYPTEKWVLKVKRDDQQLKMDPFGFVAKIHHVISSVLKMKVICLKKP